uniref:DNA helicase n=1 Tax=Staphylothermus marinus TaxID=2280 RepID=A0A7C4NPT9_STAMA
MEVDRNVIELDLIGRFKDFLWSYKDEKTKSFKYRERISQMALMNQKSLVIDFEDLTVYDMKLASLLQQKPSETMEALSQAIKEIVRKEFPEYAEAIEKFYPRLRKLPKVLSIRELNSDYIGQMIAVEGIVTRVTPIEVKLVRGRFKHLDPECGLEFDYPEKGEMGERIEKPSFCKCGRTGKFELIVEKSKFIDWQKIVIQERPEATPPGQIPRSIEVILTGDIVDSTRPGDRVTVTGVLKVMTTSSALRGVGRSVFSLYIDANHVEVQEKILEEVEISREDEEKIRELARNPWIREMIIASIAPSIYGYMNIKEAIALLLFGGVHKELPDGARIRGDIHVLLVGDPGTAKSQLLQYTSKIAPRGLYTSGKGSTAAGLTATVLRDKTSGEYYLEAGAMVLADGGVACLHPNTRIIIDNEYIRIEELFREDMGIEALSKNKVLWLNKLEKNVVSLDTNTLSSTNTVSTLIARRWWRGKLVKLVFESGYELLLTPDHLLLDDNFVWKQAGEFKPGDKVISIQRIPGHDNDVYILDILPDDYTIILENNDKEEFLELAGEYTVKQLFSNNSDIRQISDKLYVNANLFRKILLERGVYNEWRNRRLTYSRYGLFEKPYTTTITPEIGYLIGFLYGKNYSHEDGVIRILLSDRDILNRIIDHTVSTIGSQPVIYEKRIDNGSEKVFEIIIKSPLLSLIIKYFTEKGFRRVFKLPDRVLNALVAGFLDSRGSLTIAGDTDNYDISVKIEFENEYDAKAIPLILRRMDIYSRIISDGKSIFIEVNEWSSVKKLLDNVKNYVMKTTFHIPSVIHRLNNAVNQDLVPRKLSIEISRMVMNTVKPEDLDNRDLWKRIVEASHGEVVLTREDVRVLYDKLLSLGINEKLETMYLAMNRDYYVDTVVSVEYVDYEGYVYDLYVPRFNNFLAEGIVVHNCIDEIDKMRDEDRQAIHEALEQQTVSIAKAGIVARLNARASVLAAGNPKYGRYDLNEPIAKNIDLPPTILSRFDLIFVIQDIPEKTRDRYLAKHVLEIHADTDRVKPFIDPVLLKKYISYARRYIRPRLTDEAKKMIEEFYVKMRMAGLTSKEGGTSTVPITPRQLEALVRLTEAYAKMALKQRATAEDAEEAIRLMYYTLRRIGFDIETGVFDIDIIETGLPRSKMQKIKEFNKFLFEEILKKYGRISKKDLFRLAEERGFDKEFVEEMLEKLHKEGLIIYPPGTDHVAKA